ncbi:copper chaperone PCu(A)C [Rhizobium sp. C1]|uniref:copper chaperone PCu(A)C n=1 Tax=Rhizobium sp. C1 TaxID=1349799 RepID=UPI001E5E10A4|nr:copper chaperone PCu(A)C [Rhizobium sp. C1]MCD2177441.1 copper chaperone PCu(A)C [Rhizobium sp. C1]
MTLIKTLGKTLGLTLAAGLLATAAFAHEYKVGELEIVHPASRAMVPGAAVGGGFMEIINHGKSDDTLVSITSPATPDVQLHEMAVTDGVMKMRQLKDGIPVPAGKTVELKKGGLHVMFMNVKTPFKEGDKVPAVLHFQKAGDVKVEFQVGPANGEEMKHDMKDMNGQKPKM